MQLFEEAREKFKTRRAKVGVLGLGYACRFPAVSPKQDSR